MNADQIEIARTTLANAIGADAGEDMTIVVQVACLEIEALRREREDLLDLIEQMSDVEDCNE